ncbi:threonylcarbamoyl-AMP synthase [Ideonella sp. 4Y11]|uniref:Threonylcarbamoyl-AMP synthase n=1 Tax=Ideonella aquatica TaxID=2824119 RepID=A0A940YKK6_9BURK|nr:L-threonylcarbamoyladenylate synthase [Ideonella aquatica]MBQ0961895.1 threonylcarbamoyl-AMP synthase [Ideonella aquatica]
MTIRDGRDPAALAEAGARLAAGELVALPTETVYGLGARADDDTAVARIFAAKGRPADHPLIVHVADAPQASRFAAAWPARAARLTQAFWPGPLTVIVPRASGQAAAAAGGQDSIGLRCPAHPVAQALLREAARQGVPGVAAPSANRFGRVSPTTAAHVAGEFDDTLLILDGGDCEVGIESAIIDCTREDRAVLLRPGVLGRAALEAVLGEPLAAPDGAAPRASGTLASHYAPRARVRLMDAATLRSALEVLGAPAPGAPPPVAVYSRTVQGQPAGLPWCRMPDDAAAAAHDLFAALRALDDSGAALIWVETPPPTPDWEGVRDRLQRAAA